MCHVILRYLDTSDTDSEDSLPLTAGNRRTVAACTKTHRSIRRPFSKHTGVAPLSLHQERLIYQSASSGWRIHWVWSPSLDPTPEEVVKKLGIKSRKKARRLLKKLLIISVAKNAILPHHSFLTPRKMRLPIGQSGTPPPYLIKLLHPVGRESFRLHAPICQASHIRLTRTSK
ncbi:hypothetical protein CEXT_790811 [Caerostris extrusa]|uniref:Uncharacterized protein n=1 Tax=Caerostris extrusa TaxID=172846 RepID=A0AAV4VY01_CAEEX|nr:hypothetical protein CEXT_790811 [Caerostris extrusa]